MKYRITWERHDTERQKFEFDAESDEEAKKFFESRFVKNSNYDWDYLDLDRIDIIEKKTRIGWRNDTEEGVKYAK